MLTGNLILVPYVFPHQSSDWRGEKDLIEEVDAL